MSERAIWAWTPRGSPAYAHDVPAVVLMRTAKRVRIRVMLSTGKLVQRDVHPENLSPADDEYIQQHRAVYDALGGQP
jgi:hypothetical protein